MTDDIIKDKKALVNTVFAFISLIYGYAFIRNVLFTELGTGMTAFVLLYIAGGAVFMRLHNVKINVAGFFTPVLMLAFSAVFILSSSAEMRILTLCLEIIMAAYWFFSAFGCREEDKIGDLLCFDLIKTIVVMPFSSFLAQPCFTVSALKRTKFGRSLLYIIIGVAFAIIPALVIIGLLTSADDAFSNLVNLITDSFVWSIAANLVYFIIGLPVAMYIFGLMLSTSLNKNKGLMTRKTCFEASATVGFMPPLAVYTALSVILLIYVLFFAAQSSYFLSPFASLKPAGYSFADYARKGFFELCRVAAINGVLVVFSSLFIRRIPKPVKQSVQPDSNTSITFGEPQAVTAEQTKIVEVLQPQADIAIKPLTSLRIFTVLMCVFTLFLIATAAAKLFMYIDSFGLTLTRVNAAWFMTLLAAVFVLLIIRQAAPKFNFWRAATIAFIALFAVLAFSNADALVARYNTDRFYSGSLPDVDVELFYSLSDTALPELVELLDRDEASGYTLLDEDTRDRAQKCLDYKLDNIKAIKDRVNTLTERINYALGYNMSRQVMSDLFN